MLMTDLFDNDLCTPTSPDVEMLGRLRSAQKTAIPATKQTICQLTSQMPARMVSILPVNQGASHGAVTSKVTDRVLAIPIWVAL